MDRDGYISNGELFQVLKMMVGTNLKDAQLQQIVDKTIINADSDGDGKISFEEFCMVCRDLLCYFMHKHFSNIFCHMGQNTKPLWTYMLQNVLRRPYHVQDVDNFSTRIDKVQ